MVFPEHNSTPDNQATASKVKENRGHAPNSSIIEAANLEYAIQVAKRFSRRTAHDFNNLIAVMQGFASILQNRLKDDDNNRGLAEQIELSAQEALKLTSWLSTFANNNPRQLTEIDFNRAIDDFLGRARAELPFTIELQVDLGRDVPQVVCDETQFERICRQLWQNAVEAMPEGGTLTWQTAAEQGSGHDGWGDGLFTRLRVQDTGEGMEESVWQSKFDPFFTTKNGKDRGLGLTMVYDAVHAHQGFIEISSEPSTGTCVDVYLPGQEKTSVRGDPSTGSGESAGPWQLLVVDDEEIIQVLVRELLKGHDLDVVGVSSGEDALKQYQNSQGAIKAVILDMSLPGMDGPTTYQKLKELNPDVKVIASSGDPHQQAVRDVMAAGAFGMLAKPFSPDHLSEVVKQAFE